MARDRDMLGPGVGFRREPQHFGTQPEPIHAHLTAEAVIANGRQPQQAVRPIGAGSRDPRRVGYAGVLELSHGDHFSIARPEGTRCLLRRRSRNSESSRELLDAPVAVDEDGVDTVSPEEIDDLR